VIYCSMIAVLVVKTKAERQPPAAEYPKRPAVIARAAWLEGRLKCQAGKPEGSRCGR
jgi:hypothetical protein